MIRFRFVQDNMTELLKLETRVADRAEWFSLTSAHHRR